MNQIICLDDRYSTTRNVTLEKPEIINKPEDKFETLLFLPPGEGRQGEGGLRTKGYFKKSYEGKPLISVITVVFNGEKYLEETILSVLNQTYDNVEYIIIDGGSTDGTLDIIKKYDHAIDYWVSERDKGIYDAMNKGVVSSCGDWISFLGSGDSYYKDALCKYVEYINRNNHNKLDYISSIVELKKSGKVVRVIGEVWDWDNFRNYMNVAHVGSLHSKELFKKIGLFDVQFKIAGDYEFLLRKKNQLKAGYFPHKTAVMDTSGVSTTNYDVFFETFTVKKKHTGKNKIQLFYETIWGIIKRFFRGILWY